MAVRGVDTTGRAKQAGFCKARGRFGAGDVWSDAWACSSRRDVSVRCTMAKSEPDMLEEWTPEVDIPGCDIQGTIRSYSRGEQPALVISDGQEAEAKWGPHTRQQLGSGLGKLVWSHDLRFRVGRFCKRGTTFGCAEDRRSSICYIMEPTT